jgi:3-methyladenine DNA glycosylase AlkD
LKQADILKEILIVFSEYADENKAIQMSAYMKNHFDFYGIQKPLRQEISQVWIKSISKLPFDQLESLCLALWKKPQRECQYLALEILLKAKVEKQSIKLFEQLLISKSWWDSVDTIASNLVGNYFKLYPEQRNKYIKKWSKSKNIWLNRTAILFQLKYKAVTDVNLLFQVIDLHKYSDEFFIQKAIGWALRAYAYTDARKVKAFVKNNALKPLSVREAMKHIN